MTLTCRERERERDRERELIINIPLSRLIGRAAVTISLWLTGHVTVMHRRRNNELESAVDSVSTAPWCFVSRSLSQTSGVLWRDAAAVKIQRLVPDRPDGKLWYFSWIP